MLDPHGPARKPGSWRHADCIAVAVLAFVAIWACIIAAVMGVVL